jgi:ABC-type uncharacterized transport system substrate-binding protein
MKRREFIKLVGGGIAWPLAARAEQDDRIRRIGALLGYTENDPETKLRIGAFRLGLEKRGWSEGRNIQIDYRFVPANLTQRKALVKELLALHPEVILAHSTPTATVVQHETRKIPVVFVGVSDPVGAGLVASLARPGGNLTGVLQYERSIVSKWLSMLKEIAPRMQRVALVANPATSPYDYFLSGTKAAAAALKVEVLPSPIENSATNIERVLNAVGREPNVGLLVTPDNTTIQYRDLIVSLAARNRLPAVYAFDYFVKAGGLMSYGTDQDDNFRLASSYVDRILRGDKPSDLPVQAPIRFQMVVNVRAAKAIGLTVPAGLLVAADEVIE